MSSSGLTPPPAPCGHWHCVTVHRRCSKPYWLSRQGGRKWLGAGGGVVRPVLSGTRWSSVHHVYSGCHPYRPFSQGLASLLGTRVWGSWLIKCPFRARPGRAPGRVPIWGSLRRESSGVPAGQGGAVPPPPPGGGYTAACTGSRDWGAARRPPPPPPWAPTARAAARWPPS